MWGTQGVVQGRKAPQKGRQHQCSTILVDLKTNLAVTQSNQLTHLVLMVLT